ncbi:MAG: hypothetical protein ACRCXC_12270 [Legionella sp.]
MYELFDAQNKKLTKVDYEHHVDHARFNIYDDTNQELGATDKYLHYYFPTFYIYQANSSSQAVKAEMHLWGTSFSIYDIESGQKVAKMSRGFFTNSYYCDFSVTNNKVFDAMNLDPKLLMTVVAIQTDTVLYEIGDDGFKKANPLVIPPFLTEAKSRGLGN